MSEVINLAEHREPVTYTVTITHHWDDTLEVWVHDLQEDERSREAVWEALERIVNQHKRNELPPCKGAND